MLVPDPIDRLAAVFRRLPGVGRRQALRMALYIADRRKDLLKPLGKAIEEFASQLKPCARCTVWTEGELCAVCADPDRDRRKICVIEDLPDLESFETSGVYTGLYHVLHGRLAPSKGTGPGELSWEPLLERLQAGPPEELVLALSHTTEGETTAAELCRSVDKLELPIRVTRIVRPSGAGPEPEYWEREELEEALTGRRAYHPETRPRRARPASGRSRTRHGSSA
ncbi:MAG: recombination protein RecR [Deltaproteobacteria bacterium]|nr:recombination protein RecR [Deltaproteobacteria bacterium]